MNEPHPNVERDLALRQLDAAQEPLREQQETAEEIRQFLTATEQGDPTESLVRKLAGNSALLGRGLELAGGIMTPEIVERMGLLVKNVRILKGHQVVNLQENPSYNWAPTDERAYKAAQAERRQASETRRRA